MNVELRPLSPEDTGRLFLAEAQKLRLEKVLVTVWNSNLLSIRAALANGGAVAKKTEEHSYIWIPAGKTAERNGGPAASDCRGKRLTSLP